jgi:hypothetical protein
MSATPNQMKYLIILLALFAFIASSFAQTNIGFRFYGASKVGSTTVGTAGTGYTSPPTVAFSGGTGGVQATGTSRLKVVGSVTITTGGTGYSVGNVLTVVGGSGTAATLTVSTVSTGVITAVTITTAGAYSTIPTNAASTTVNTGPGAGATVTLGYGVGSIVLTQPGAGYLTAPTIAFSGGGGTSAAATATLDGGATAANVVAFSEITPQTDSVISAITFPEQVPAVDRGSGVRESFLYSGDRGIIGKTLTAGRTYRIAGTSVTFASGTGSLVLRPQ